MPIKTCSVRKIGKTMNFSNFLINKIALKGTKENTFGSLTSGYVNQLKNVSLFESANLDDLKSLDLASLLSKEDSVESSNSRTSSDIKALQEIIKTLMELEQIQDVADLDGNGEISEEEALQFLQTVMGLDGDAENLTMEDMEKVVDLLGINLEQVADNAVLEALSPEAAEELEELKKTQESQNTAPAQQMLGSGSVGSGSVGSTGGGSSVNNNSSTSKKTATKTAADTLKELQQKKQEIIADADKKISKKEEEKDKLVSDNSKISKELKQEYTDARTDLKETQDKKSSLETKKDGYQNSLSKIDQDLNALKGEKSSLKTDTKDDEINSQNKSRLKDIESQISAKKEKKADYEKKIENAEKKIKELETKEKEQQEKLAAVEEKISQADPKLGKKIEKINSEIKELKTQKASDVSEIDSQIQIKEKEANKEAKQAGVNKGKAANDIGSGLVELASKYMGMNEADGSYKLFTNGRTEAWCADFVTYVVKEYAQQQGLDLKDGFGSPSVSNLRDWAQKNGAYESIESMSSAQKSDYLKNDLQVGDIIIWKRNGKSHTGIVKSINNDGTFTTVEGNSSDQVKSNVVSINDNKLSGFIKFNKIVS